MNDKRQETLGSVILITKGKKHLFTDNPSPTAKRIINIEDLRHDNNIRYTNDARGVVATKSDVLIAWDGANAGTVGYGKNGYIGSTIARLRIKKNIKLFPPFLGLYLKSNFDYLRQTATGATIPHINRSALENIPLPTVSFDDQKRIAHLLDTVDGLISERKRHLQQLDALLQSVFMQMFGDPVRNEKGWEKVIFSQLLDDIESGHSPKCEAREANEAEWGVLKLGAVTSCFFKEYENKALPNDITPKAQHEVKARDVLFSRKNTYELVAACAYVFETRSKLLLPDLIFRFKLKKDAQVNPIFLWKLLAFETQRGKIQSLASGAAGSMPNISKTNLKQVLLPRPPLLLQNQFAAITEKVEGIKQHYQHSLSQMENLYGVLSQKAFKGELDLSRVPEVREIALEAHWTMEATCDFGQLIADLTGLDNAEKRKTIISDWLESWVKNSPDKPLSIQDFMDNALPSIEAFIDGDEQKFYLRTAFYDDAKDWVFASLQKGTLQQTFDDTKDNAVRLHTGE